MSKKEFIILIIITILISILPKDVYAACSEYCNDVAPAIRLVKIVLIPLFQLVTPIGLIVYGMIDFSKAVVAGKQEEMVKQQSMFIKRCIYGIAVFLVVTIVTIAFNLFSLSKANKEIKDTDSWLACYNYVETCSN